MKNVPLKILTRPSFLLALLLIVSFVFLSHVSLVTFRNFPFCMDEHDYSFQAHLFAQGHLYQKISINEEPLRDTYMITHQGKLFVHYPPGFPILLAIGVLGGIPGLINPFLSIVTLFFIYKIAISFVKPSIALCAVLLVATNSYFIGYGASYFSQPMTLTVVTIGFYLYRKYELSAQSSTAMALGLLIGLCVLVRQVDALCLFLVIGSGAIYSSIRDKKWTHLIYIIGFPLLSILILCAYFFLLNGEFSICTPQVWDRDCPILHRNANGIWQNVSVVGLKYYRSFRYLTMVSINQRFIHNLGNPFLILALGGLFCKINKYFHYRCLMSVLVFIILYTFEPFDEWAQYGARYYYPTLGAIAILVAFGLNRLGNILPRYLLFAIITISLGYQLMNVRHDLKDYSSRFDFVETITKDIHQHCPGHSIVIIKDPHFYFDASTFTSWSDFHRNFIPSESRFFVYNKQEANLLNKSYPSYGVCEYNFSNNGSIN